MIGIGPDLEPGPDSVCRIDDEVPVSAGAKGVELAQRDISIPGGFARGQKRRVPEQLLAVVDALISVSIEDEKRIAATGRRP